MRLSLGTILAAMAFGAATATAETPEEVFAKRIAPIFKSDKPSSCVQCHLSGVDLKNYILPSSRDTFLSLRDQGLIDFDAPEKSKILGLIAMGGSDTAGATLIHEKMRKAEHAAFTAWITASAADPALRAAPKLDAAKQAGPARPVAVVRHARKDRLLETFENTVWAMRFRCMSCHSEGSAENRKHVEKWGERVAWFKSAGPEATLDYLMKSKLIDVKQPQKSLLLQKPLNAVKHEGGKKFEVGDQGYKAMRAFVEDYARIVGDGYKTAAELPKPAAIATFGTDAWLKLFNTPAAWGDKVLTVAVHAWDEKAGDWESTPIATTDRRVFGKGKLWQHSVTLLAAVGSDRAKAWKAGKASLPEGRYLIKVFVDANGRLEKDWKAGLGEKDYVGQIEVQSDWREGYGKMTEVDAGRVAK